MTLTEDHIRTLRKAPFVIPEIPHVPHDLCRKGLLEWAEGAWRLTAAGREALSKAA